MQENTATDDQATTLACDRCGQVVETADMVYMLVPDSCAISALGAQHDGMRLLAVCSSEHLGQLREQYRQRPFVKAGLWAGKLLRATGEHGAGVYGLFHASGLTPGQLIAALRWLRDSYQYAV